jgi:hypothetical protein
MTKLFPIFLILAQGILLAVAHGQPPKEVAPTQPTADNAALNTAFDKVIELNVEDVSTDDFLIRMANAADVNVIADVTDLDLDDETVQAAGAKANEGKLSSSGRTFLITMVNNLSRKKKLTWLAYDERTLLFWRKPNITKIAQLLANGQDIKQIGERPDRTEFKQSFQDYLLESYFKEGARAALPKAIPIKDLPASLRINVIATAQGYKLKPELLALNKVWVNELAWKHGTIRAIDPPPFDTRTLKVIQIEFSGKDVPGLRGNSYRGLGGIPK